MLDGNVVFGGPCQAWIGSHDCSRNANFVVDEALFYDTLVPVEALAAHASLLDQTTHASVKAKSHHVISSCVEAFCALQIKDVVDGARDGRQSRGRL